MKISIYSSGDNPPFWNIGMGHMTLKELEEAISLASMIMNAAREAKLKIKDEDPNQLKLEFDVPKVFKKSDDAVQKAEKKQMLILENQLMNPYYGCTVEMTAFLQDLDDNFEKEWVHVDDDKVLALLNKYNKNLSTMNHKLRKLAERGHCELKFREKILKQFYLNFKK